MSVLEPRQHRHLGVYGVCIVADNILLVRKARGPYTGLLDLPGGSIEFGESFEAALKREFREEAGIDVVAASFLRTASTVVRYTAGDGMTEDLHHLGVLYTVSIAPATSVVLPSLKSDPDGQDSGGALWVPRHRLNKALLSPFAQLIL